MNNSDIIRFCQNNIIDNTDNNIVYIGFTKYDDYIILHIFNPNFERFNITPANKKIMVKLVVCYMIN